MWTAERQGWGCEIGLAVYFPLYYLLLKLG